MLHETIPQNVLNGRNVGHTISVKIVPHIGNYIVQHITVSVCVPSVLITLNRGQPPISFSAVCFGAIRFCAVRRNGNRYRQTKERNKSFVR